MKQANPSTSQTEEAYEWINKRKEVAGTDAARIVLSMKHNEVEKANTIRLTIPHIPYACKSNIPQHIDMPRPKKYFCKPKEIWDMLNNIKDDLGKNQRSMWKDNWLRN